ncbi:hypothetical protein, conserved in T. vivax, partial [Trypanosoma vivax Y486]
PKQKH